MNVVEGSEQRLECNVQGHPTPTVEWRKGGGELPPRDGLHAAFAAPHSHYLHIRAAAQEHAGRYTCIASNKGGEVRQIIQLNVLGRVGQRLVYRDQTHWDLDRIDH